MKTKDRGSQFILWFSEVGREDVNLVGGKNSSLGEMFRKLSSKGVKVPNGFAITTTAYKYFIQKGEIEDKLRAILAGLNEGTSTLDSASYDIRRLILATSMPANLKNEIVRAYRMLEKESEAKMPKRLDVAVRSSATAEDTQDASFAGQLESFLNIQGEEELIDAVHRCFASNFTSRVIDYRKKWGYDHLEVGVSVGVQKMARSDLASSGISFTIDTNTGFEDVIIINAGFGLGEPIVGGQISPDEYFVSKSALKRGFRSIIGNTVLRKTTKMVYAFSEGATTAIFNIPRSEQYKPALSEDEILQVAEWSIIIEEHYGRPMDIEWAKDGLTGEIFIVQARPATGIKKQSLNFKEYLVGESASEKLLSGISVGRDIVTGRVKVVENFEGLFDFCEGEILVTHMTTPSWEPAMRKALAMITNDGGRNCHAAIIAKEEGIPSIVGARIATNVLQDGQIITVDCSQGEEGFVYNGEIPFDIKEISLENLPKTSTDIMIFANKPRGIFAKSAIPANGIGLARSEFVISEILNGIHPMAWVCYPNISERAKEAIDECASHYSDKTQYFIDKMAEAWGRICAAMYPRPVIMRFSDFKSNEYADLVGGDRFEPAGEANPMMGLRGVSRYLHESYRKAFRLECEAVKKTREVFGFDNLIPMLPFCRTPEEAESVLGMMEQYGLKRGVNGLEVYMMVEIPSNVFLIKEFAEFFDGFSIGSNDLTQLIYGVDRDSGELAGLVNENHEGLRRAIKHVILSAHESGKKVGICGEAPSYLEDFTRFLVECGIDSITITSGSLGAYKRAVELVASVEKELLTK